MKKLKKVISVWLATLILLLPFSGIAGAEEGASDVSADNRQEAAPFVFVHGLFGWGQYDEIYEESPYWGGGGNMNGEDAVEVTAFLRENGYEAYAASVGPVSSAWDRACELYAQLTGSVVDYGEAHSKAHNHERYGKSFEGNPLMGKEWDINQPINLVGHSFGGPTIRLFTSLMTYGDEAEIAASGSGVSPLFSGGHNKAVHSVTTLSGVHNGSPIANMLYDHTPTMYAIGLIINVMSRFGSNGALGDFNLGHFGLTAKQSEDKASFSIRNIINFVNSEDNAGYDLTLRGSKELNERIKISPDTYYYSYSSYITEKNCLGRQKNTAGCFPMFYLTCEAISFSQCRTYDGIKMTEEWAVNDGMVPLASAKYPLDEADNAKSYEDALAAGSIEPGIWYYFKPIYGVDHLEYCDTNGDFPQGYRQFYLDLAKVAS